ncbi:MAG: sulfite exporter TauE/SafE family protein [Polyangiales bacterium]
MIEAAVAGAAAGLASIPHCAGMCGPLASAACGGGVRAGAAYQLGRLATYTALGSALGAAGSTVTSLLPGNTAGLVLGLGMAASLLWAAHRTWRGAPSPLVPLRIRRAEGGVAAQNLLLPLALGFGTGLLPCGSLYAALLLAASAGKATSGAIALASFAITSSTGVIGAQSLAGFLRSRGGDEGRRIVATVLVLGAALALLRPLSAMISGNPTCHGG